MTPSTNLSRKSFAPEALPRRSPFCACELGSSVALVVVVGAAPGGCRRDMLAAGGADVNSSAAEHTTTPDSFVVPERLVAKIK